MLALLLAGRGMFGVDQVAEAAPGEVLIFNPAGFDGGTGTNSLAAWFTAAGKTPVIVSPATWSTMTTAQFAAYDAIAIPDPTCYGSGGNHAAIAAAVANAATWGAAVDGNVIVIGTDEVFHRSGYRGDAVMDKATDFVVAEAGKTGAYISLSCYYHGVASGYDLPWLKAAFGGNWDTTGVGCYNDAHIVATHPALAGLTDGQLSGWSCSVHEAFTSWPLDFEVMAIARGIGAFYTAPDGSVGTPYIVARGVTVISDIDLSPDGVTNNVGETHTVTAVVTDDSSGAPAPVVGTTVTFTVIAGPHTGTTGTDVTDGTGTASFSYVGTAVGTDTIEATFVDSAGRTQRSNRVTKTWEVAPVPEICGDGIDNDGDGLIDEGCNTAPDCSTAGPSIGEIWPPNHKMVSINVLGVTDADGDTVSITINSIWQDEPVNTVGDGSTGPDGAGVGSDTAQVRAERTGTKKVPGDGRVYHIGFTADDGNGGSCSGEVKVGVPHDQGKGKPAVDGGALYDSTVG
jgi:hypothetical protein